MASPDRVNWKGVKWNIRYLRGTFNFGFLYGRKDVDSTSLWGFVDFYYARDMDRRRSLTVYKFVLNSNLVNWKASLVVALLTTS